MWSRSEKTTCSTFAADSFPFTWHSGLRQSDCWLQHPAWSSEVVFFMKNSSPVEGISFVESGIALVTWQRGGGRVSSALLAELVPGPGQNHRMTKIPPKKTHSGENHHRTSRAKIWQGPERVAPNKRNKWEKPQLRNSWTNDVIPKPAPQITNVCAIPECINRIVRNGGLDTLISVLRGVERALCWPVPSCTTEQY